MTRMWTAYIAAALLMSAALPWPAAGQATFYDRPKNRPQLPGPMGYVSDHA